MSVLDVLRHPVLDVLNLDTTPATTPATTCENGPLAGNSRLCGPFLLCPGVCHLVALWTPVLRGPRTLADGDTGQGAACVDAAGPDLAPAWPAGAQSGGRVPARRSRLSRAYASASLFHGAPAVAFVLHTAAHPAYAAMLAALDEHINDLTALKLAAPYRRMNRGELTRPSEYDLISGLTGLGLYYLVCHGSAGSEMASAVLEYLVALSEPQVITREHCEMTIVY